MFSLSFLSNLVFALQHAISLVCNLFLDFCACQKNIPMCFYLIAALSRHGVHIRPLHRNRLRTILSKNAWHSSVYNLLLFQTHWISLVNTYRATSELTQSCTCFVFFFLSKYMYLFSSAECVKQHIIFGWRF